MEINGENLGTLYHYLGLTLQPDLEAVRQAEAYLQEVEKTPGYAMLLLAGISQGEIEVDMSVRIAAAIAFKNFIKRNWAPDDTNAETISQEDRVAVKTEVVDLMLQCPRSAQLQLSEAIAIIGKHDFPEQWPDLLGYMVSKFEAGDFNHINGVLQTAQQLFRRYQFEYRTDALFTEIIYVLGELAQPLTDLINATIPLLKEHEGNPEALATICHSIHLICQVFYSLNFQDIPEFFEDNMQTWMDHFHTLLTMETPAAVASDDDEKPGIFEEIKTQICENITLYATKYDDVFKDLVAHFVEAVWVLLTSTGPEVRNDQLVSAALLFLAGVAERPSFKDLYENEEMLQGICEKVIVPNITLRPCDLETFEDDPEEYIRRDIEGSDVDTRRRSASDLVRALCMYWEEAVTNIFSQYVGSMLEAYAADPADQWPSKDGAIYLVTSLAVKGKVQGQGTTKVNAFIDVIDFLNDHIRPLLQAENLNEQPLLRADAIKYVMTFRNQIPREMHQEMLPEIGHHLESSQIVVNSYAACYLERAFVCKPDGIPLFTQEVVVGLTESLLTNLFACLGMPGNSENEYIMKTILRTISTAKEGIMPFVGDVITKLSEIMEEVSKNPSKPKFNHFIFETFGCTIRYTLATDASLVSSFEDALFPPFQEILTKDVVEFQPYVFQLLAQMLETRQAPVPEPYMALFPHLLAPALWESSANTTPLVRLLRAFLRVGQWDIFSPDPSQFEGVLGIFQKLIASKANDHEGFNLLRGVVEFLPLESYKEYLPSVFSLCFKRIQAAKTSKFMNGLFVFVCTLAGKYGGSLVVEVVDSLQERLFAMMLNRTLDDVQRVSSELEKKICAVGMTKMLTETPEMLGPYAEMWTRLLGSLVAIFELDTDETANPEDVSLVDDDSSGYKAGFAKLQFSGKHQFDPFPEVDNPRGFLATQLYQCASQNPGTLSAKIQELEPEANQVVQTYLQSAGVGQLP
eukprot:m.32842 g.32842  ORF g.32842 m.32842 type:complete len:972 (-) comp15079_c0_seq1:180-3095(-)